MRFDSEAYDKLYPRNAGNETEIESAVETFTPTADEQKSAEDSTGDTSKEGENGTDSTATS
ncbi:hypothetical protein [Enterococcus faecium]|uniref:hypothetical protein n=1 Tax=Enterococcus faecium TaxID=1352 RepID=UPI003DA22BDB